MAGVSRWRPSYLRGGRSGSYAGIAFRRLGHVPILGCVRKMRPPNFILTCDRPDR